MLRSHATVARQAMFRRAKSRNERKRVIADVVVAAEQDWRDPRSSNPEGNNTAVRNKQGEGSRGGGRRETGHEHQNNVPNVRLVLGTEPSNDDGIPSQM